MAKKPSTGVQVVKGAAGDMMLVIPVDRALAAAMARQDVMIALARADELRKIPELPPKCLALFGQFRLRQDFIINPITERRPGR